MQIDYTFWGFIVAIATLILLAFSVLAQYLGLFGKLKPKPEVSLQKGDWKEFLVIRIQHPTSRIQRCRVVLGRHKLGLRDNQSATEKLLEEGTAAIFAIKRELVKDNEWVSIYDQGRRIGDRRIVKVRLTDIEKSFDF